MKIDHFATAAGADVSDIDLRQPLSPDDFERLRDTLVDRGMLVFRNQTLTPEQLVRFSRSFGDLEDVSATTREFLMPGFPDITLISNIIENGKPIGVVDAGQFWHTDRSYVPRPAWASILYAREVPRASDGSPLGETLYANMVAACAALAPELRKRLTTLRGWHQYVYRFTKRAEHEKLKGVEQPVIATHPISGRSSLYVNAGFTHEVVGLPQAESRALLDELFAHASRPEFVHTHRWNEGDVVMWDNFSVQHRAVGNYTAEQRRLLWRTAVRGFELVPQVAAA